jgi:hypothetical protein
VVLVGRRQDGRERDEHVTPVLPETDVIVRAIRDQLAHGRYAPSTLYGDGHVAARLAEALAQLTPYIQKRLHYIADEEAQDVSETERELVLAYTPTHGVPLGFMGGQ